MSLNDIIAIEESHPKYVEGIDGYLARNNHRRFFVSSRRDAWVKFRQLARELDGIGLEHGTLMFLGYEHLHESMRGYFLFGANPDVPSSERYSIINDYDTTIKKILERDKTVDKHDGAYLFSPDGLLFHAGAYFDTKGRTVLKAYGYSRLYELKNAAGIKSKGGTRLLSALFHSMIFLNAEIVSISSVESNTQNYIVKNGILRPF